MAVLLVAVLGALIPTVFYVSLVWWIDRYEKEPLWLLALAFLWGAGPAALVSVILELVFDVPISALAGETVVANLASVSISAPLVEESTKGIALVGLVLLFRREFDDALDGIVYGAMIGFGFACTENLFAYFLPILRADGLGSGLTNILLRTAVFGFNHAFWTALIGAAIGHARLTPQGNRRILMPIAGWSLAVLFHGIHNAGATLVEQTLCLSLGLSLAADWGGLLLLLAVALLVLRRESQWIELGLEPEVRRGALSPEEFDLLRSAGRRMRLRWRAWTQGGRTAYRAVGDYYQVATELSFKRRHLQMFGEEGGNSVEIERLQEVLETSREAVWPWLWS